MKSLNIFAKTSYTILAALATVALCCFLVSCDDDNSRAREKINADNEEVLAETEVENQTVEAEDDNNGDNKSRANIDISNLQVSRYEESEMDGADSYHVYSNVSASEANLAAFRDDCIIGVAYTFNMPINEATSYVDRALAREGRVVIKDKYYSYTLTFEVDSVVNKQGAYSLDMYPDTIGWLDW